MDLWSCGEDLEEDENEGDGDLWVLDGETDIGDNVLDEAVAESVTLLLGFCSENLLEEKKLGLEFLKQGEFGGTGGLGSLAGL